MSVDIVPLMTSFALVFMAELGDKTQLTAIMLSSKASSRSVFAGAMLAFLLVDGVSALIGGELLTLLPYEWVSLGSGLVFMFFGFYPFLEVGKTWLRAKKCPSSRLSQ